MSATQRLEALKAILPGITAAQVSSHFNQIFDTSEVVFTATLPSTADVPSEDALIKLGREALDVAFGTLGLDWSKFVEIDPHYYRPTEVDHLCGDPSKAKAKLGWQPRVRFKELIEMMVKSDEADVAATLQGRKPTT